MTQDLLVELRRRGVRLRLVEGRLDVLARPGALTPELREELRDRREELMAALDGVGPRETGRELVARPAERHEPFPLTDIQHAYWVGRGNALELGGVSTHIYFELEREGLDRDRLTESLRRVIARHDMLRAVISPDGTQRVLPEVPPYEIEFADLRGLAPEEQQRRREEIRAEMDHQVLPAHRWPLFDIRASRTDDRVLRLHISLDTLILDGASMYLLFRDWRRFYEDPGWSPAPLELSYRDHVLAEARAEEGARYRRAREYWLGRLDELPPAPALPLAKAPSAVATTRFGHRHGELPPTRWDAVKSTARRLGLTPSAVLMTLYAEVLRLWSEQPDFTLDVTLFNRPQGHPELPGLIGDFTSVTLLEVRERPGSAFAERVSAVQRQLMRDLEHAEFSGVRVMRELSRRGGSGPGATMPVVFTSALVLGGGEDASSGIRFFGEEVYGVTQTPQVWLDHQVTEERGALLFNWDAVEELFPEGVLDDMFALYCRALERLADDASLWEADAGQLVALPQRQAVQRARVNNTAAPIPARTLGDLVEERARTCPDAVAVLTEDTRLGYGEVTAVAHRLAHRLLDLGVAPNTLVGVVMDKGPEQVPAVLGVVQSGAAYLPVDPQWPEARRSKLLRLGGARVVLTTPRLREELTWPDDVVLVTAEDPEVRAASTAPPRVRVSPDDLAYVIFTSGSTGEPKGVMIDHRGAANTVQDINARFGVGPDDRVLALSALGFDLSVYDVFGVLAAGGALVMPSPARLHDPAHWRRLAAEHRVTVWNSVPALMQAWTEAPDEPAGREVPLRLALLSGDWIPVGLPDAARALHPGLEVISLGGATEASIWSVFRPVGEVPAHWTRIPYGKPLANQTLHVYDDLWRPRPVWSTGEICIGGTGLAKGYWGDPERTAERFVTHPVTGERLYRTGDLGRCLPDGDIEFLGRRDFQVKLNGYRIELGEIEAALREQPGVAEALAAVRGNPRTGRAQLVAYLVARPGGTPEAAALREALQQLLPSYMVPHHYVLLERLPLSANGKVDRAALPDPWPAAEAPAAPSAPREGTERLLLELWARALGHEDFGVEDNFFELGGDSLHAVRILAEVRGRFGLEQDAEDDLEMLFDHPTVRELARAVDERLRR
ncbi:amino acid adenylation domain-containing protein [Streptomyces sp. NPDC053367]|uniref:amino acid adenylation domain-containing protein n=1 Tax=Streptomyces sp. NPDC053367 TaxID=3365700 RepID=UPI0037CFDACF